MKGLTSFEKLLKCWSDLRSAYKLLKNGRYVHEEAALQKEIVRTENLLAHCRDEKEKLKQMKKINYLQFKRECCTGKMMRLEAESLYFDKVVGRVTVKSKK